MLPPSHFILESPPRTQLLKWFSVSTESMSISDHGLFNNHSLLEPVVIILKMVFISKNQISFNNSKIIPNHFKISNLSFHFKTIFILFNLKYHFNSHFKTVYIHKKSLLIIKMKLLCSIIELLNFQNFQLPKFIYSLKFIKTVKIHFSWHLENATERYIQNSSI